MKIVINLCPPYQTGTMPPLGLGYLKAILKEKKHQPIINDINTSVFIDNKELFEELLDEFVEQVHSIVEIESIILHGKEEQKKANILLIGKGIPFERIKSLVVDIKEKYDFTIIDLTLEPDQFFKMSEMGLFPGKRTVLFQK